MPMVFLLKKSSQTLKAAGVLLFGETLSCTAFARIQINGGRSAFVIDYRFTSGAHEIPGTYSLQMHLIDRFADMETYGPRDFIGAIVRGIWIVHPGAEIYHIYSLDMNLPGICEYIYADGGSQGGGQARNCTVG